MNSSFHLNSLACWTHCSLQHLTDLISGRSAGLSQGNSFPSRPVCRRVSIALLPFIQSAPSPAHPHHSPNLIHNPSLFTNQPRIALLREQAIAATLRTTTPPTRDSYSSRGHGRNGSYASTLNTNHGLSPFNSPMRDRMRHGSVSSHPTLVSYREGHIRNGSLASSHHSHWGGGPASPQRTRHASVY